MPLHIKTVEVRKNRKYTTSISGLILLYVPCSIWRETMGCTHGRAHQFWLSLSTHRGTSSKEGKSWRSASVAVLTSKGDNLKPCSVAHAVGCWDSCSWSCSRQVWGTRDTQWPWGECPSPRQPKEIMWPQRAHSWPRSLLQWSEDHCHLVGCILS